jgi:uncharacterized protein (UPF0332 family)
MPKHKTLEQTYDSCLADGLIRNIQSVNHEKIHSLAQNAQININSAEILAKSLSKDKKEWLNVFTLHYEALRIYAEALLLSKMIQSNNHQCLFSALCTKFPDLELDWNFFESVRTKRNGVNYYGELITYVNWKQIEIQMKLYLSTLHKEVKEI